MTNQEIFDKVVNHLLTQNEKAMTKFRCQYRTEDGLKCAIGCLIPDEKYRREFDDKALVVIELMEFLPNIITIKNIPLLEDLQYIHDKCPVST